MTTTTCFRLALLAWLAAAPAAAAQQPAEPPLTRIPIDGDQLLLTGATLSPDGRWIALVRSEDAGRTSLWLAPAAGGELVRLTDSGYVDVDPAWGPSGDRLYFGSNRPARGEPGYFIMMLRVDPQNGRALDAPRQVTLERTSRLPRPSPDGRYVLYQTGNELRVAPAAGGNSRIVAATPRPAMRLEWAADGSAVYYGISDLIAGPALYRVPAAGGTPVEVVRHRHGTIWAVSPPAQRMAVMVADGAHRVFEIIDWSGRVVASREFSSSSVPGGFTPDGSALLVRTSDARAITRARPVAGGAAIDLAGSDSYEWAIGWTADSRSAIVIADVVEQPSIRVLPIDGSAPRIVPLPAEHVGARPDQATPAHVSYSLPTADGRVRLMALDLATGQHSVLTENRRRGGAVGPGGLYRAADGFSFTELVDGEVLFRTVRPGAEPRTVFRAPHDFVASRSFAFHGTRMAYLDMAGDSLAVMVVDAPGAQPRLLTTLGMPESAEGCCRRNIAFSHDGTWLVAEPISPPHVAQATLVRVPAQGRAADVRTMALEAEYWYEPRWLPDNSGFTYIAGEAMTAWVAFAPTAPGERVRHLSRADGLPTWGHELSPDGRFVVYAAEVWQGTSLWRMELR